LPTEDAEAGGPDILKPETERRVAGVGAAAGDAAQSRQDGAGQNRDVGRIK
jgi:hypothetical protein